MADVITGLLAPLALVAIVSFPALLMHWEWQAELVDRGLALYCPDTGNWAWVGECTPTPSTDGGV